MALYKAAQPISREETMAPLSAQETPSDTHIGSVLTPIPGDIAQDRLLSILGEVGLTPGEYHLFVGKLGRQPNMVELGMAGAMWSEHCGYKHSKPLLRKFPTGGPHVL